MTNLGKLSGGAGIWLVLAACAGQQSEVRLAPTGAAPAEPEPVVAAAEPTPPVEPAPPAEAEAAPSLEPAELAPDESPIVEGVEPTDGAADAPEPAKRLHESLDRFEEANTHWELGDLDDALEALDRAYELMAGADPDGDPLLAQEKENLRQLISRRVVEIYASRKTSAGGMNGSIPLVVNADVEREIASFQGRERSFFLESYARSGLYRPMILRELEAAGLPEQLSWLPLVESGFKDRAISSARALGLWQFIASTGYRYGLDRSDWIDERMDPEKSTKAAIAYLTALHDLFGDWLPALAGYNCGEGQVLRQIKRQSEGYFDQFWDLYARLPHETRRYVPRFLATLAILEDPAKYGFVLPEPMTPPSVETIEVARATKLESLDKALGLDSGTLAKLNPELRRNATPKSPYALKVPAGTGPTLVASLASIPEWTPPKIETGTYRVRSGDTLGGIAARHRTSVQTLMAMNNLRSAHRLSIGQRLRVPVAGGGSGSGSGGSRESAPAQAAAVVPATVVAEASSGNAVTVEYRVRSGDNLWEIATRFGTTTDRIRSDNGLKSNLLQVGQLLRIRSTRDRVGG